MLAPDPCVLDCSGCYKKIETVSLTTKFLTILETRKFKFEVELMSGEDHLLAMSSHGGKGQGSFLWLVL